MMANSIVAQAIKNAKKMKGRRPSGKNTGKAPVPIDAIRAFGGKR